MFDWLNDLMRWIGNLIPRWALLEIDRGGIRFSRKGRVDILEHGVYWWWPATSTVAEMPIKRQTLSMSQRLTTKDHCSVLVGTVIVFEINDVIAAMVNTKDFEDTVTEVAQKLVVQPITRRTFDEILVDLSESNEMRNEIARLARSLLKDYGVSVIDAYISDFAETTVFSHDGEGMAIGRFEDDV